ncbi:hypothetical protein F5Y18DRAFT_372050 [Xylariaceae sp. FL1019]|nr:hypothetical protein F5Y18DRAFT_372050 [Xylariaceae sp. FL1019]
MKALRNISKTTTPRRLRTNNTTLPNFNTTTRPPLAGRHGHPHSDSAAKGTKTMEPRELPNGPILALPETPSNNDTTELAVGSSVRFDDLGPVVVNVDGSLSRISNWDKMSTIEKENTYRIIGKRNAARRAVLLERQEEEQQDNNGRREEAPKLSSTTQQQSPAKDPQTTTQSHTSVTAEEEVASVLEKHRSDIDKK